MRLTTNFKFTKFCHFNSIFINFPSLSFKVKTIFFLILNKILHDFRNIYKYADYSNFQLYKSTLVQFLKNDLICISIFVIIQNYTSEICS